MIRKNMRERVMSICEGQGTACDAAERRFFASKIDIAELTRRTREIAARVHNSHCRFDANDD